jgi:hypothetical protein
MKVTVVDDECVTCLGVFHGTPFSIAGEAFKADLFALPLVDYDIVLGTHWLASLEPILWDFSALNMPF